MRRTLASESQLVFADEGAPELPDGFEAVGGDPRKIDLAALVEDELLLELPIIPQHEAGEACGLPAALGCRRRRAGGGDAGDAPAVRGI